MKSYDVGTTPDEFAAQNVGQQFSIRDPFLRTPENAYSAGRRFGVAKGSFQLSVSTVGGWNGRFQLFEK